MPQSSNQKNTKKRILAIIGSTRAQSSNLSLVKELALLTADIFDIEIYDRISELPHFNPDLDKEHPPQMVVALRHKITEADGIIICTPEYVFSLPGSLKNAIEWCVSTTVLSQKATGLITASASGQKGHEELQLVMKTVEAKFNEGSTLLIRGIKSKFDEQQKLKDAETKASLEQFGKALSQLIESNISE